MPLSFIAPMGTLQSVVPYKSESALGLGTVAHTCDPSTGVLRREDFKFEASLRCVARICPNGREQDRDISVGKELTVQA